MNRQRVNNFEEGHGAKLANYARREASGEDKIRSYVPQVMDEIVR